MTVTAETVPQTSLPAGFQHVALAEITPSATNPRKTFEPKAMAELIASISQYGLLQPIVIRPLRSGYEVVAGERRYRACRELLMPEIPAIIRPMSDDEVLEIQILENLNREDLEPMEEAAGFRLLHERSGLSAEEIAGRIKKSPSYVYSRMRLTKLPSAVQKAVTDKKLSAHGALLLGSIATDKLQLEALKQLVDDAKRRGEPSSIEYVRRVVRDYQTDLSRASWDLDDAQLVAEVGPCTGCPRRTGGEDALFSDMGNVCLDAACFARKSDAVFDRYKSKAIASGGAVMSKKEVAEKVSDHLYWDKPNADFRSGIVMMDETCRDDPKRRTYRELLGDQTVPIKVGRTENGRPFEAVDEKIVIDALKATHKFAKKMKPQRTPSEPTRKTKTRPVDRAAHAAQEAARMRREELDKRVEKALMAAIVAKAEKECHHAGAPLQENLEHILRLLTIQQIDEVGCFEVVERRWKKNAVDPRKVLKKHLSAMKTAEVFGVLVETMLYLPGQVTAMAEALSIPIQEIAARVKAEFDADDAAAAASKAAKSKKPGATTAADGAARADAAREAFDDFDDDMAESTAPKASTPKKGKTRKVAKR